MTQQASRSEETCSEDSEAYSRFGACAAEVTLHVYDVKFRGAALLNSVLLKTSGAFHTGVEVHGREWSFGATADEDACGIFACAARSCRPHEYRESVSLGTSKMTALDVFNVLLRLEPTWSGASYDVLRKNCNSFCIVLAGELGAADIPRWTHCLGDGIGSLDDRARRALSSLRRPSHLAPPRHATDDSRRALVVSDNHGEWTSRKLASYADAKKLWAELPLTHASVLFVSTDRRSKEDDLEVPYDSVAKYAMPSIVFQ